jgi:ubiquinol-cytochrome c reductase cytochrome c subunit
MKALAACLALAVLTLGMGAVSVPRAAQAAPAPGAAAAGRKIFAEVGCYQCHGYVGQGSIMSGPALVPQLPAFETLRAYVRHPSGQMPPFSERVLSDAGLEQIYAYLASLPPPLPVSRIPLLRR